MIDIFNPLILKISGVGPFICCGIIDMRSMGKWGLRKFAKFFWSCDTQGALIMFNPMKGAIFYVVGQTRNKFGEAFSNILITTEYLNSIDC